MLIHSATTFVIMDVRFNQFICANRISKTRWFCRHEFSKNLYGCVRKSVIISGAQVYRNVDEIFLCSNRPRVWEKIRFSQIASWLCRWSARHPHSVASRSIFTPVKSAIPIEVSCTTKSGRNELSALLILKWHVLYRIQWKIECFWRKMPV